EGGSVEYIEGCSAPRFNASALHAGCVELNVKAGARIKYSSIENWSKNTFNLNTKRAVVGENAIMEWVNGNLGSFITMLYPCSMLAGKGARSDYLGIAFAGNGQHQDTGCKMYHLAPNTTSTIRAKSISKDAGITSYRGLVRIIKGAQNAKCSVQCDALLLDEKAVSNTFPYMRITESSADVAHEATVGRISQETLFYLMSRGLSEEQALQLVVSGFIEPIAKELPLEYAVEFNRLIQLEMANAVG
ncbi:MAG TPA: Fe-S cluster assembly protein SufB, partial [archaeon]|nr:Fe-S cluster assembly protein SufB [archaeon]